MKNRVSVAEAAEVMGVSQQFVRIGMQRGKLPIGDCVKMSSKYTYYISPLLLSKYTGVEIKMPPAATDGTPLYKK